MLMNFGTSISTCMGKYATFSGRASRSEYWWFYLFTVLLSWGATIVGSAMFPYGDPTGDILTLIITLIFLIPIIAAASRRLHDTGRSGWWQLISFTIIGIIPLVIWVCSKGTDGSNRFGPDPLTATDDTGAQFQPESERPIENLENSQDSAEKVRQLHKLKDEGLISEDEFQSKKEVLLKDF